jgi:hypothetical protein
MSEDQQLSVAVKPKLPDRIREYVKNNTGDNAFRDLFEANNNNIDLKSEFNELEIDIINKIEANNAYLISCLGEDNGNIYGAFLLKYKRLKVSFMRISRKEFVDVNRKDNLDNNLQKMGAFAGISKVKE